MGTWHVLRKEIGAPINKQSFQLIGLFCDIENDSINGTKQPHMHDTVPMVCKVIEGLHKLDINVWNDNITNKKLNYIRAVRQVKWNVRLKINWIMLQLDAMFLLQNYYDFLNLYIFLFTVYTTTCHHLYFSTQLINFSQKKNVIWCPTGTADALSHT